MYDRAPIDPGTEDPLAKISACVPSGSKVLDVGCAVGRLGEYLSQNKKCVVDGIEVDQSAAAIAARFYRDVIVHDIEQAGWWTELYGRRYDVVVCADVLEHLREPDALLKRLTQMLAPGGRLLLSVPNISHAGVLWELFMGDFRYRNRGLLDKTHLRFYTERSLLRALADNGYKGHTVARIRLPVDMSEFAEHRARNDIPPYLWQTMCLAEQSDVYQFVVEARPLGGAGLEPLPCDSKSADIGLVSKGDTRVSLYWRDGPESFDENHKTSLAISVGDWCKVLKFAIPTNARKSQMRLDPSEAVDYLRLHDLVLRRMAEELWRWDGRGASLRSGYSQELSVGDRSLGSLGIGLWTRGSDGWFEIPAPAAIVAQADTVEVVLSSPAITHDYLYSLELAAQRRVAGDALRREGCDGVMPEIRELPEAIKNEARHAGATVSPRKKWHDYRKALAGALSNLPLHSAMHLGINWLRARRSADGGMRGDYANWIRAFDTLTEADRRRIRADIAGWEDPPKISIIMPVHETPERFLIAAIESVRAQLYPFWELCISDDASSAPHVQRVLRHYMDEDDRIKVIIRREKGHIANASNDAIGIATGKYLALLDHDDALSEHAVYWLAKEVMAHPECDLVYSDEDKIDEDGNRMEPFFKPEWSPHLAISQAYLGHIVCFSARILQRMGGALFDPRFDGSQDYDAWLRISSYARGIRHVARVLYHWRKHSRSTAGNADSKPYAHDAGRNAVRRYVEERYPGNCVRVKDGMFRFTYALEFSLPEECLVTIIIPTRDRVDLLRPCVNSIKAKSSWTRYEIIIIDNGSVDEETMSYLSALEMGNHNIRRIRIAEPFNWSRLNNAAAKIAKGRVLVFLNNDTEIISHDWMEYLAGYALLPDTGVVGGLLLFGDGRIQHSGVVVGMGGWADHVFRDMYPEHSVGPYVSPILTRNVLAVTGACLAIERGKFEKIGGFDEGFVVCGSDVEIGIRAYRNGYFNVLCAEARLYHMESKTRDPAHVPESDFARSAEKYRPYRLEAVDPFFNPNLTMTSTVPKVKC